MIDIQINFAGYPENDVLHDISLCFNKGCLTSIIGPNGCGKSTLLKTILGLTPKTDGEILINNTPLKSLTRKETARNIAYLSQGKNIPNMTVFQMVLHGRFPHMNYPRSYSKKDKAIALDAMERMGIAAYADTQVAKLSGGMRQNAYIAMALAQDTEYILLDEPMAYLDISHQIELMKLLSKLAKEGKSIVTVMHDLPIAFTFSDVLIVLRDGYVVSTGTPKEIYEKNIVKDIFGINLKHGNSEYYYDLSDIPKYQKS